MDMALRIVGSAFGFALILGVFMFFFPSCMTGCSTAMQGCNTQSYVCQDSVTSFRVDDGYSHDYDCTTGASATWEEVNRENKRYIVVTCTCDPDYVPPVVEEAVNHGE